MIRQQIADHLHEALNGLTIGWQMANVPNAEDRERLQAPIIAGQESIKALLAEIEEIAI